MELNEEKRQTDSEVVAALIWLAFVVPGDIPPVEDDGRTILGFRRALDFYAETVAREADEAAVLSLWDHRGEVRQAEPKPEPESDTPTEPRYEGKPTLAGGGGFCSFEPYDGEPQGVTIIYTDDAPAGRPASQPASQPAAPPKNEGEDDQKPVIFSGKSAGLKKVIHARLCKYCEDTGLGAALDRCEKKAKKHK